MQPWQPLLKGRFYPHPLSVSYQLAICSLLDQVLLVFFPLTALCMLEQLGFKVTYYLNRCCDHMEVLYYYHYRHKQ